MGQYVMQTIMCRDITQLIAAIHVCTSAAAGDAITVMPCAAAKCPERLKERDNTLPVQVRCLFM